MTVSGVCGGAGFCDRVGGSMTGTGGVVVSGSAAVSCTRVTLGGGVGSCGEIGAGGC